MSWSVAGVGQAGALRAEIKRQFDAQGKCAEPEESVRQAAKVVIDATLAAYDQELVAEVSASGSQFYKDWAKVTGIQNSLVINVSPKGQFIAAPSPSPDFLVGGGSGGGGNE